MDFFASQDIAKRNTRFLLFLFLLAVVSLVIMTNLLVFVFINFQDTTAFAKQEYYFDWETSAAISLGVVGLIGLASMIRMHLLRRGGGAAVAEMMDGELLVDHDGDFHKQRLLNVVQEMAIASGTPVPPVYLINSSAINAFAAGYSPGDAVIGITRGALLHLNRDELQGVIAHEFSHILNGDMRLNIRLMGVLYGILVIALLGRMLLRPSASSVSRDRSHAGVIAMGAGLMAIGYLGQFFGNIIKAAVSRQREYLADSSAVQFTRNPAGISAALQRIGGFSAGSVVDHPESAEISHAFFTEGITFSLSSIMATHPPLEERIKRIDPSWNGKFLTTTGPVTEETEDAATPKTAETAMGFAAAAIAVNADDVVNQIGNPEESQVEEARRIISSIPELYIEAASTPYSARALVYLFAISEDREVRDKQLSHLEANADLGVYDEVTRLLNAEESLDPALRLPVTEMVFPTLRQLSYEQYKLFLGNLEALIRADGKVGLSEWALQKLIRKHLGEVFESQHSETRHKNLKAVKKECALLLSLLAYADHDSGVSPETAFDCGTASLEFDLSLLERSELSFNKLNKALDELAAVHPLRKPRLIKACVQTIAADEKIAIVEAELLRTVADILECPMPPLSANQN